MKNIITMTVDAKGVRRELVGPSEPNRKHKEAFTDAKSKRLQKGVVAVESWERVRVTTGIDAEAQDRRLAEDKKATEDKA
jgi:hypothetical protein